jgi:SAM-dependent methyltransferase
VEEEQPGQDPGRPDGGPATDSAVANSSAAATPGYSLENATIFGWNSISGDLLPERVELLKKYVVGRTVLDAGCGGGGFVDYLARQGFEATGLDKHEVFLQVARQRQFKGRFVQADLARRLPFADGSFDTTVCFDVLEHVADDGQTIRELARVTRRRLVLAVPQADQWMWRYRLIFYPYRDPTHLRYYTPESLRALAASFGPRSVNVFGEQAILLQDLALQLLHPRSRYPLLTRVYQHLFKFLVLRSFSSVLYQNLAAVIDLQPSGPAPSCG